MGDLHNPLYMWGNLAGFDDTRIDEMLGLSPAKSLRNKYVIPPVDTEVLLSFFMQIGAHPKHVLPVKNIGYPKPIIEALVMIAESSDFSVEARNDAVLGLRQIQNDFEEFYNDTHYPEHIEELWEETQIEGLNLNGVEITDSIIGLFNIHTTLQDDPSLLTQRKFGLYETRLRLDIHDEEANLEQAKTAQKKHNRVIIDVRNEIFGDDDGEFAGGYQEAEKFIFEHMAQPKFSKMTKDEKWNYVGIMLTKPNGVFSHLIDPKVRNKSFSRNVGDGRFLGWPELGHAYAEGYRGLRKAEHDAERATNRLSVLSDEIDDFHEFIDDAEQSGDITLYDAKHMIDEVDFTQLRDSIHEDLVERRSISSGISASKA